MASQLARSLFASVEDQIDAAIEKLQNLKDQDLEAMERKRVRTLVKEMEKEDWIASSHGEYTTLATENDIFNICKKSKNVVLHCYKNSAIRCAIIDEHLALLATTHIETKFCKLDVEKAPLLCDRLKVRIVPTIIICKEGEAIDFINGFDLVGRTDDFSTEILELRLAKAGVINYKEDLSTKLMECHLDKVM